MMAVLDLVARGVAITVLLFVGLYLILSLLSYFLPQVWPLRHSFLIALLSSICSAVPLGLIHLTRSAAGPSAAALGGGSGSFLIFALLTGAFAVLFTALVVGGQIRL
jgi:hypothetical protein